MQEFGEFVFTMIGMGAVILTVRVAWIMAVPISMFLARWVGKDELSWHRGTASGRPPLRWVEDGWGRIVYAEIDPDPITEQEGGDA